MSLPEVEDNIDCKKYYLCLRPFCVEAGLALWGSVFEREAGLTSVNLRVYPLH
jgi:hypothetical protein